ncbi:MAG TPA: type IX secretion system membrane protein PorP/SprF [Bacteroidales bacterium]|nr:type IX secretion system membrane protein PorP/SprF [Bacteroidales bacterium]
MHRMRNLLRGLIGITLLVTAMLVYSQQEPQFSHNMFNHVLVNPGFAGMNDAISATGIVRQQWVGLRDAEDNNISPETFLLSVDATVPLLRGGIGGTILQDQIGFFTINGFKIGYSYHHRTPKGRLGIGLQVGLLNHQLDGTRFNPVSGADPILNQLQGGELSNMMADFSAGVFYEVQGQFYVGLSSSRIMQTSSQIGEGEDARVNFRRHYYLTGGYQFPFPGNNDYQVLPSVFIKSDGSSVQFDLNTSVVYKERFWGGMSYRHQDAIVMLVGLTLNELKIGYSYDIPLSAIGGFGSHEIMVNYSFKLELEKERKSFRNTRFL